MSIEHTANPAIATRGRAALAPWLPPRTGRSRPTPAVPALHPAGDSAGEGPAASPPPAIAGSYRSVTVSVEITVSGPGALPQAADIADQLRAYAAALTTGTGTGVAINAALVLTGEPPAVSAAAPEPAPLRIQPAARTVHLDGEPIELTRREFDLLLFLARQPGRVFTRGQLLQTVWGHEFLSGERTVDVHVRRIRAKLRDHEALLTTVRGVGYRFAAQGGTQVLEEAV